MRPGQNRRSRGRNNNNNGNNNGNRRGGNPLTRSYESSGPDVKVRGTAQTIAERYAALARDALSAGDRVIAENYLQHAEHYNRIIAAAMQQNAEMRRDRDDSDEGDDMQDDDGGQRPEHSQAQDAGGEGNSRSRSEGNGETRDGSSNQTEAPQPVMAETPREFSDDSDAQSERPSRPRRGRPPRRKPGNDQEMAGADGERPAAPKRSNDAGSDDSLSPASIVAKVNAAE